MCPSAQHLSIKNVNHNLFDVVPLKPQININEENWKKNIKRKIQDNYIINLKNLYHQINTNKFIKLKPLHLNGIT